MALVDKILTDVEFLLRGAKEKLTSDQFEETEDRLSQIVKLLQQSSSGTTGRSFAKTGSMNIKTDGFQVTTDAVVNSDRENLIITDLLLTNLSIVDAYVAVGSYYASTTSPVLTSPEKVIFAVPQLETKVIQLKSGIVVPPTSILGIRTQASTPFALGDIVLSTTDLDYTLIGRYDYGNN